MIRPLPSYQWLAASVLVLSSLGAPVPAVANGLHVAPMVTGQVAAGTWDLRRTPSSAAPALGMLAGGRIGYGFADTLDVELDVGVGIIGGPRGGGSLSHFGLQGNLHFLEGTLKPFATVGSGAFLRLDDGDLDLEVHYGAGLHIGVTETLGVRVEALHLLTDGPQTIQSNVAIAAGLRIQL